MALSSRQVMEIKEEIDSCKRPIFFFDDDQDGLCAFLLLYRYKKEGKGVIVKSTPKIGREFLRRVEEFSPDKIFILDIADVDDDFLDKANVPVVWIDHHGSKDKGRGRLKYFNPRVSKSDDNFPTSYLCYQAVEQELWIASLGCVADWFLPPFLENFRKEFPLMIENNYKTVGDIIYNSNLGKLIRIFSFVLKGEMSQVTKCINILTRIKNPYEILNKESSQGGFIYKRFEKINRDYEILFKDFADVIKKTKDRLVVYEYKDDKSSFTSDMSNEAVYRFPEKIIIVGRKKGDEMRCSIRSGKIILPFLVEKSLIGLDGYGGGHEHACGLSIKIIHFGEFVNRFSKLLDSN